MFDKLKSWSEMTVQTRYNFLLGGIILILLFDARAQRVSKHDLRIEIKDLRDKNEDEKLEHIRKLQRTEDKFYDLLWKTVEIKTKKED